MKLRKRSTYTYQQLHYDFKFGENMAEGEPLLEILISQHEDDTEGSLFFPRKIVVRLYQKATHLQ